MEEEFVDDDLPELILRSESKAIALSIKHMNRRGEKDLTSLKDTVLYNFHGKVSVFSRKSFKWMDSENRFRQACMWLVDSK
jgi:hypothetical protein